MYVTNDSALETCGLETLHERREHRALKFALKCNNHKDMKTMFPLNPTTDTHDIRKQEVFKVNKTHTKLYKKSEIPYLERRLNNHFDKLSEPTTKANSSRNTRMEE